jgi:hypothetical protein
MISVPQLDFTGLLQPQIPHSVKLLNSLYLNGIACDLSECGTGKTYAASWVAKQFNSPVVIICPRSAKPAWDRVLKSFGVNASLLISYEKLVRGNTPYLTYREPTDKATENWRYLLSNTKFPAGSLIICDEVHKCKATTSLSAGMLIDLKRKGYKLLILSATMASKPTEMRATGYAANLHNLYQWKEWCLDNGAQELSRWGVLTFDPDDAQSQEKLKKCHINLFETQQVASRLTREQMGNIFPENHINPESFDLGSNSTKIQSIYDTLEEEIARLDEETENYSGHVFALIMKARMKVELCKMPFFIECINEIINEKNSAVVFVNFNNSLQFLKNNLRHEASVVVGGQNEKLRESEINLFQSNKRRAILCNIKTGGNSINLHDLLGGYPRQSLISPTWSVIDLMQSLGRIPRADGKSRCYQRIIYANNTIENRICSRLRSKINNLGCLNDGDLAEFDIV